MALSDRPSSVVLGDSTVATQTPLNVQATPTGPLPASQNLGTTAETLLLLPGGSGAALSVAVPPDTALEQTVFDLYASGIITTKNSTNITLKLYEGTAIASGNLLGSSGAIAQNTATAAWWIHAKLIYDSVSGVLAGWVEFYVNKTLVGAVTLSHFVSGFLNAGNPSANPPTVANLPVFCLSVTSSADDGTHVSTVNVQKFSVG